MTWNPANPGTNAKIRLLSQLITTNWNAIEDGADSAKAFKMTGVPIFTSTSSDPTERDDYMVMYGRDDVVDGNCHVYGMREDGERVAISPQEGSWTPDISNSGALTVTQDIQVGKYTRVGNLVHVYAQVQWSAGDATFRGTNIQIYGLPYTVSSETNVDQFLRLYYNKGTSGALSEMYIIQAVSGGTSVTPSRTYRTIDANPGISPTVGTFFLASGGFVLEGSYYTDDA